MNRVWRPAGATLVATQLLRVGDVVGVSMRAALVTHISETPADDGRTRVTLRRLYGRPFDHENSADDSGWSVPKGYAWQVYDEGRVPLCSCCGDPWPCSMVEAKAEAAAAAGHLEQRLARAGDGLCYGCGQPITGRQGSVTYPEDNVDVPGYPAPRFHTRASCDDARSAYEVRRGAYLSRTDAADDAQPNRQP